ncbi:MAG: S41 family peptidase [bacterium]|nr:S41 family peptidase [bacterium]
MKKIRIIAILLFLFSFSFALPFSNTQNAHSAVFQKQEVLKPAPQEPSQSLDTLLDALSTFQDALTIIKKEHLEGDKITAEQMSDAIHQAIKALLKGMVPDDPFSSFLSKKEVEEMEKSEEGFKGIGVVITYSKSGNAIVQFVFPNSPAEKAGLKIRDEIQKVDEKAVQNNFPEIVREAIDSGKTETVLLVKRGDKIFSVKVAFGHIDQLVIKTAMFGEVGYLALYTFQCSETKFFVEFCEALIALKLAGAKSLILDLRYNTGGSLVNALMTADALAAKSETPALIITIKNRFKKIEFFTRSGGDLPTQGLFSGPIIILVNDKSASASEIVAGALQDWGRAKIIGQKTFGKGVGQKVIPFSDGSLLILLDFYYYLPSGRSIHGVGITPDISDGHHVEFENMSDPGTDPTLNKAIKLLNDELKK